MEVVLSLHNGVETIPKGLIDSFMGDRYHPKVISKARCKNLEYGSSEESIMRLFDSCGSDLTRNQVYSSRWAAKPFSDLSAGQGRCIRSALKRLVTKGYLKSSGKGLHISYKNLNKGI